MRDLESIEVGRRAHERALQASVYRLWFHRL